MDTARSTLYKYKRTGQGNRAERTKTKVETSRKNREDLLANKRRIPLSEINTSNTPPCKPKEKRPNDRLERLKQWQKARDEAKAAKKNAEMKKLFRPGAKLNFCPQTKPICKSVTTFSAKKAVLAMSPRPPRPIPAMHKKSQPFSGSSSSKPVSATTHTKTVVSSKKEATRTKTEAPSKKEAKKPISRPSSRNISSSSTNSQSRPTTRSSSNQTVSTRPQTRSTTRVTRSSTRTAKSAPTVKESKPPPKVAKTSARSTKKNVASQKTKPAPAVEDKNTIVSPTTPVKSYVPVQPSPLLLSKSSERRVTMFHSRFVDEQAWVPGGEERPLPLSSAPDFDLEFGTKFASPFRFTAGTCDNTEDNQATFTFRMDVPELPQVPTRAGPNSDLEPPQVTPQPTTAGLDSDLDPPQAPTPLPFSPKIRLDSDLEVTNSSGDSIVDNDSKIQPDSLNEPMDTSGNSEVETKGQNEEHIDIAFFRKIHSDVTDKLVELCGIWEAKTAAIEEELETHDDATNADNVMGQVRTTIGQAQLLMRKKLKQYLGLVDIAEKQSGERKTTSEDLQGFWDMVYFQVEDVYKKFEGLEKMESNGWTMKSATPKRKPKRRGAAKKMAAKSSKATSERLQAAREKREAERKKLKEMREAAAKRAREEAQQDEDITKEDQTSEMPQVNEIETFSSPPKKIKTARTPRSSLKRSTGTRRSVRLQRTCVFSPQSSQESGTEVEVICPDVPTAMLLSFTPSH